MAVATGTALAVGAVAGLAGSYLSSRSAASAQSDAANQSNATLQNQYNQTRQDQLPWMNRGNAAGNQMAYLMGLPGYGGQMGSMGMGGGYNPNGGSYGIEGRAPGGGGSYQMVFSDPNNPESASLQWVDGPQGGDPQSGYSGQLSSSYSPSDGNQYNTAMGGYGSLATPFSQTNWQTDPGYAFRLSEGSKALERSAAAKGMSLSGAQQKALAGYNQNFASNEYNNIYGRYTNDQNTLYNRLAGIAGTGQQANQFTGSLGANMANGVANTQASLGNALGANYLATGNAFSGAINNGVNSWMNQNNWNQLMASRDGK